MESFLRLVVVVLTVLVILALYGPSGSVRLRPISSEAETSVAN